MLEDLVEYGNSVYEMAYLYKEDLDMAKKHGTSWYRSKGKKGGDMAYTSFMLNKKWALEEEFNIHMLRFHQVTVSFINFSKNNIDIPGWIGEH